MSPYDESSRLPRVVAIPYLSGLWLLNEYRARRARRAIRILEGELAASERARFGRSLTDSERELYYRAKVSDGPRDE